MLDYRPHVCAAYLEFEMLANYYCHDVDSLGRMKGAALTLRELIQDEFPEYNLNFIKFFSLRKFYEEPVRSACANLTDTSYHERSHKELKAAARFTNNHHDTRLNQIAERATATDISIFAKSQKAVVPSRKTLVRQSCIMSL